MNMRLALSLLIPILYALPASAHYHKVESDSQAVELSDSSGRATPAYLAYIGSDEVRIGDEVRLVRKFCKRRDSLMSRHRHWARTCHSREIGTARVVQVLSSDRSYIVPSKGADFGPKTKVACAQ